jgi:hypothetical protein
MTMTFGRSSGKSVRLLRQRLDREIVGEVPARIERGDADAVGAEEAADALDLLGRLRRVGHGDLLGARRRIGPDVIAERIDAVLVEAALDHEVGAHPARVAQREVLDAVAFGLLHAEARHEHALEPVDGLLRADALVPLRARVDVVALVEALELVAHLEAASSVVGAPVRAFEAERPLGRGLLLEGQAIGGRLGHRAFLSESMAIILTSVQ